MHIHVAGWRQRLQRPLARRNIHVTLNNPDPDAEPDADPDADPVNQK